MIDFISMNAQRDDEVARIVSLVLQGCTAVAEAAIDVAAQVYGIHWRNMAGRVMRHIEQLAGGDASNPDALRWVEAMKQKGVNSPLGGTSAA